MSEDWEFSKWNAEEDKKTISTHYIDMIQPQVKFTKVNSITSMWLWI